MIDNHMYISNINKTISLRIINNKIIISLSNLVLFFPLTGRVKIYEEPFKTSCIWS